MKKLILAMVLISFSFVGNAQTAVNFNVNDCSGTNHDLFTELDAGKVIVLCWVMPCGACAGPAITSYNVVQSYATSNPNRVFFYLVDDYANTNCTSLGSWATTNNLTNAVKFSNSAIDMMDYGSTGMPKIVVVGGSNHQVLYNVNNSVNATSLQNAINTGLGASGISNPGTQSISVSALPNPAKEATVITVNMIKADQASVEVVSLDGKLVENVFSGELSGGQNLINLNLSKYSSGIYFIKLKTSDHTETIKLNVVH